MSTHTHFNMHTNILLACQPSAPPPFFLLQICCKLVTYNNNIPIAY